MLKQASKTRHGNAGILIALLTVAIACMYALHRCSTSSPVQQPATAGTHHSGGDTLDIAIAYSPTFYYKRGDSLVGFHYELLHTIALRSKRPMKFHPIVTLASALQALNKGYYDLVAAEYPVTSENKARFLFTDPVMLDKQVLVQRVLPSGQVAIKSQLDLAGDTVWVVSGSPMADRVAGLSREIGDTIVVASDRQYGPEQLFLKVASGEVKYAVVNESIARALARSYRGKVDVGTAISFTQFQCWVLRAGNRSLQAFFNSWLRRLKASGDYDRLRAGSMSTTMQAAPMQRNG